MERYIICRINLDTERLYSQSLLKVLIFARLSILLFIYYCCWDILSMSTTRLLCKALLVHAFGEISRVLSGKKQIGSDQEEVCNIS